MFYCSKNPCVDKLSPPCAGRADVSYAWSTSYKTQTCSFKFKLQKQKEILLRLFSYSKNNGFNYYTSCDNAGKERLAVCAPVCWTKKLSVLPLIVQESMDLSFSDYCIKGGGVEPMVNQRFVDGMSNEMFEVNMIIDHLSIGLRTDGDVHFMWIFFVCWHLQWLTISFAPTFFRPQSGQK